VLPDEHLHHLLRLPLVVVLDEAYVEFAGPNASRIARVPERKNLIVLRSFSKWAGLAGIRIGYGAFPEVLMPHLWKIKQPYNVSVAASQAALAALSDPVYLPRHVARIAAERHRLHQVLSERSFLDPYRSRANFILCRVVGRDAGALKRELERHGILIRYFDKPGLRDHVRFSVGRPEDTERLADALRRI
jgi:histidinol-phosphate aminotransferase